MEVKDLPTPLSEWLHEPEVFGLRIERLYEDARMGCPSRMLGWLVAAYEIGLTQCGGTDERQKN